MNCSVEIVEASVTIVSVGAKCVCSSAVLVGGGLISAFDLFKAGVCTSVSSSSRRRLWDANGAVAGIVLSALMVDESDTEVRPPSTVAQVAQKLGFRERSSDKTGCTSMVCTNWSVGLDGVKSSPKRP